MDYQRANITDVCNVAEQLKAINELDACLNPALNLKGDNCTGTLWAVELLNIVVRGLSESGIVHASNLLVRFEPLRNLGCVRNVTLHPKTQSFNALKQRKRGVGGDSWTKVPQ